MEEAWTALVSVVVFLYLIRFISPFFRNAEPEPDEIAEDYFQQFVGGFRPYSKIEFYHQMDRVVVRSLLHSCGIPTAEWHNRFAAVRIGVPISGYTTVDLVVLEEHLDDALRVIADYWARRNRHEQPSKLQKLRVVVEFLLTFWFAAPVSLAPTPRIKRDKVPFSS